MGTRVQSPWALCCGGLTSDLRAWCRHESTDNVISAATLCRSDAPTFNAAFLLQSLRALRARCNCKWSRRRVRHVARRSGGTFDNERDLSHTVRHAAMLHCLPLDLQACSEALFVTQINQCLGTCRHLRRTRCLRRVLDTPSVRNVDFAPE